MELSNGLSIRSDFVDRLRLWTRDQALRTSIEICVELRKRSINKNVTRSQVLPGLMMLPLEGLAQETAWPAKRVVLGFDFAADVAQVPEAPAAAEVVDYPWSSPVGTFLRRSADGGVEDGADSFERARRLVGLLVPTARDPLGQQSFRAEVLSNRHSEIA